MKRLFSAVFVSLLLFSVAGAQDLTLDNILSKYYKAMGYENLQKVNTIIMTGTMIQQDAMPVKIIRERPDQCFMEFDIQDITAYQGFDGQTAWWTTPWTGNPKPQIMPDDRAKDLKSRADFDGLLFNWKSKGHLVELIDLDTVETSQVYKLKITKKDGGIEFFFIDATKFILLKRLYYRVVRGKEVAMENYYRDYRSVQGVLFSFTQDTHFDGQPYNSLQFDAIELNKLVDGQIFRMPEK
ncbi:MAG: hypothetical protein NTX61_01605 [Bacteroidetes bacterium]|nr:hypothetical protein [Bacteroidota bacterium]